MHGPQPLSSGQHHEATAICDEICEWLEKNDEYVYDLNERRGKAGSFKDEAWDKALAMLRGLGWDPRRTGAVVTVRKPRHS
jgi:hypothetical protein